jgi:chemotaxis protein CheC
MSTQQYTELQLDALGELANIGSGTAGTALAGLLGRPVDLSVPKAAAMSLEDAVGAAGPVETEVGAVLVPIVGDLDAVALLLFPPADADAICGLLGLEARTEDGASAMGEIGNILCASYVNALATMLGMELEPRPPQVAWDMLGAIVASVLLREAQPDGALVLDSNLIVEGESCSLSFLLLPTQGGISDLLGRMGV